ncbi:bifunctional 2-polyprenyl-6-hydroxyphenol methylase/3-demethylubiquinol 3-O-methyltransferase UbiG [Saccharopolyspora gloriosae]|uniref:class I SAM-dependent methyltransferase n=1 Tax=Saccharopolyspora gloriosae TaxID=455344 RepID=UPI001FB78E92|nr:methyltransferase domain-containing protein [Saccharopolyspora gloriosae]
MHNDANFLTDNPELYEQQFPDPEHLAARFVLDLLGRHGAGNKLLDVGCGSGRDAGFWSRNGYRVTGIDTSPRMIEYARAQCPDGTFLVDDMREFRLDDVFDAITCLDSAFLYCHTNSELDGFLERCRAQVRPGGLLIAEMRNGAFFLGSRELLDGVRERSVSWNGVDYRSRTRLWIDHAEQLLRRERIWDWPGCGDELTQRSAWRLLFPQELHRILRQAGFEVLAMFDHPGPRTDPAWHPGSPLNTSLTGDRLHLIARRPT